MKNNTHAFGKFRFRMIWSGMVFCCFLMAVVLSGYSIAAAQDVKGGEPDLPRVVRVVNRFASQGQTIVVSINVDAEGDEALYGFSLTYESAKLMNPTVAIGSGATNGNVLSNTGTAGQIGVSVDFNGGTKAACTNCELITVTFQVAGNAPFGFSPINFSDTPTFRETSSTTAQPLATTFQTGGGVTIQAPRVIRVINANTSQGQMVTVSINTDALGDEALYGFSLNYETAKFTGTPVVVIGSGATGGNVQTNINTMTGRIGFSVDFNGGTIPPCTNCELVRITFTVATNAPIGPSPLTFGDQPTLRETSSLGAEALATSYVDGAINIVAARVIRVISQQSQRGATVVVPLNVDALGDEALYGFSLNYDSSRLTLLPQPNGVVIGTGATGGNVLINDNTPGQIGVSIDFNGGTMPACTNCQLIRVSFTVAAMAPFGLTPITYGDVPAIRETSSVTAQALATSYDPGTVNITPPTSADATVGGRVTTADGRGISRARVSLTDNAGLTRTVITNPFGYYRFDNVETGETYVISATHKRYQFSPRVISVSQSMEDVNFTAEN